MTTLQDAKARVQAHYEALEAATDDTIFEALSEHCTEDLMWRGVHPFNGLSGIEAVAQGFWQPFLAAVSGVQRRQDIFFAATNPLSDQDGVWTVSMGHLMGLFDAPFLNIPAPQKLVMLRYAEFNRVVGDKIVETAFFADLLHLMTQAGIRRFPNQTAQHLVQPGPRTHDGLLFDPQDPVEGAKTLALIEEMIHTIDAANANPAARTPQDELRQTWADDMTWWGPEGIGATYTIDRYIAQHQQPFRHHMKDRTFNGHLCRIAEGTYGAFFGWPNLTLTNHNGFLGVPPNDIRADMRVVDVYRRAGDKLVENWIFIDMLHFLKMQGVDVLAELAPKG